MRDAIESFRAAIAASGLTPPDVIDPGRFHRFPGVGKRNGNTAGWCKLFVDTKGGIFGDFSTGLVDSWQVHRDQPADAAEREEFRQHVEQAKAEAQTKRREDQAEAAKRAAELWDKAEQATAHPYLTLKGVGAHGVRIIGDTLLVPMRDGAGKLWSVQRIAPDGSKRFLQDARVTGCYHAIGKPDGAICIAEGYATGASIHEATGYAVAVAFNAGNLEPVARALRDKYPDATLILCADDDHKIEGNPGIAKATAAARAVGGLVAIPDFGITRPDGASDFNDMARLAGNEAVAQAIGGVLSPHAGPDSDVSIPESHPLDDNAVGDGTGESDEGFLQHLASLSALAYAKERKAAAKQLGIGVGVLDREVRARRDVGGGEAQGSVLEFAEPVPWAKPVYGAVLLDEIAGSIRRYVALPDYAARALALWSVHSHTFDLRDCSPLLVITSPTKRCGKTTALDVMRALVHRPLATSNITPAALFRVIEACKPTLLIDEFDTFFKANEELRGIVNSGHTRAAAHVIRTVGDDHEPRAFSTWAPKLLAGIGDLPETVLDRAVVIELRRRLPTEQVERGAGRLDGAELRAKVARWVADNKIVIANAEPEVPGELNDRAQDNWRPLLSIADAAGGDWPEFARNAAKQLSVRDADDESTGVLLLADIRAEFDRTGLGKLSTKALVEHLLTLEERPWGEYRDGRPITPALLSRRLRGFKIVSKTVRIGEETAKGFEREQFSDAWARYLPPSGEVGAENVTPSQRNWDGASGANGVRHQT